MIWLNQPNIYSTHCHRKGTPVIKNTTLQKWHPTKIMACQNYIIGFQKHVLKRWSFQKNCAGIWSFLYYRERWYFFFPKIWSYTLDGKWKMIFLKKYTEIWYFLQTFWKYGISKKCRAGTWSFLYYLKKWYFFSQKHDLFSLGRRW